MGAYSRGGLICKNDLLGGGLFEGGLFGGGGLFEDLRYVKGRLTSKASVFCCEHQD